MGIGQGPPTPLKGEGGPDPWKIPNTMGISCSLSNPNTSVKGAKAASQGLAWAPSYIPDCVVMFER